MRQACASASVLLFIGQTFAIAAAPPAENQIVRVVDGKILTPSELITELEKRRFIILGERHGRADHQDREAFILAGLADRGRYPGVAFEMITPSQEPLITAYRDRQPEYAMGLGSTLEWWKSTWPSWSFYAPVFQVAFAAKLPIFGAELEGVLKDEEPPLDVRASWTASLDVSHCGLAPPDQLSDLAKRQWQRDRRMAAAMLAADVGDGAVLIAGLAHARRDRSVPRHLVGQDVVILGFVSSPKAPSFPSNDNQKIDLNGSGFYDYIWYVGDKNNREECKPTR